MGISFIAAICPPYKMIMVLNISPAIDKLLISVLTVFKEFLATGAQSTPGDKLFSCLFLSLPFRLFYQNIIVFPSTIYFTR